MFAACCGLIPILDVRLALVGRSTFGIVGVEIRECSRQSDAML